MPSKDKSAINAYLKARREEILSMGYCPNCYSVRNGTRSILEEGKKKCSSCMSKNKHSVKRLKDTKRAKGECTGCSTRGNVVMAEEGHSMCRKCLDEYNAYREENPSSKQRRSVQLARAYAKKKRNGECVRCSTKSNPVRADPNSSTCLKCKEEKRNAKSKRELEASAMNAYPRESQEIEMWIMKLISDWEEIDLISVTVNFVDGSHTATAVFQLDDMINGEYGKAMRNVKIIHSMPSLSLTHLCEAAYELFDKLLETKLPNQLSQENL